MMLISKNVFVSMVGLLIVMATVNPIAQPIQHMIQLVRNAFAMMDGLLIVMETV